MPVKGVDARYLVPIGSKGREALGKGRILQAALTWSVQVAAIGEACWSGFESWERYLYRVQRRRMCLKVGEFGNGVKLQGTLPYNYFYFIVRSLEVLITEFAFLLLLNVGVNSGSFTLFAFFTPRQKLPDY